MENGKGVQRMGNKSVPILLYADDAVLIACTANGLHILWDLQVNFSKSSVVTYGRPSTKSKSFKWMKVKNFNYLEILFNQTLSWVAFLTVRLQSYYRNLEAIFKFAQKLQHKLLNEMLSL